MANVWTWYRSYSLQAMLKRDHPKLEALQLYEAAVGLEDGPRALSMLRRSRAKANAIGETCLSLFLSHWITENLLWTARDYTAALDNALEAVVRQGREDTADCPVVDRLYINLVEVYTEIDPHGYRTDIEDSLAYVRQELALDYESECMMAFRTGLLHLRLGELDAANDWASRCLGAAEGGVGRGYYIALGAFVRGGVAFARRNYHALADAVALGISSLEAVSPQVYVPEFAIWNALALHHLSPEDAPIAYRRAIAAADAHATSLSFAYYEGAAAWHLAHAENERAQTVYETWGQVAHERGAHLDAAEAGIALVGLLTKRGDAVKAIVEATQADIAKLRDPMPYLHRLDKAARRA